MRVIAPLWLAFVVAMSMMPLKLKDRVGTTGILHIPGHFFVCLITAILLCRTAKSSTGPLLRCVGMLMEVLETVAFHNSLEWRDMVIDFLGAASGLVILKMLPLAPGRSGKPGSREQPAAIPEMLGD